MAARESLIRQKNSSALPANEALVQGDLGHLHRPSVMSSIVAGITGEPEILESMRSPFTSGDQVLDRQLSWWEHPAAPTARGPIRLDESAKAPTLVLRCHTHGVQPPKQEDVRHRVQWQCRVVGCDDLRVERAPHPHGGAHPLRADANWSSAHHRRQRRWGLGRRSSLRGKQCPLATGHPRPPQRSTASELTATCPVNVGGHALRFKP